MTPQDLQHFKPSANTEWIRTDARWFQQLAEAGDLSPAERVHLARVAIQQQWVCDVEDTAAKRSALEALGLRVVAVNLGHLIVSGSEVIGEYLPFRNDRLSTIEAGVFYGYPPSAVVAFTGITASVPPQRSWLSAPTYFLGGAYSRDHSDREWRFFANEWAELSRHAPAVCDLAEAEFKSIQITTSA